MSRLTRTHLALEADRDRLEKEAVKARGKVSSAFIQFLSTVPVSPPVLINPFFVIHRSCGSIPDRKG